MKVLLLTDKPNWAYDSIAKALIKYNHKSDDLYLKKMPIKANVAKIKKRYTKFDKVLVMGWQTYDHVKFIPKKITLVGLHSFHSWDNRKTTPEKNAAPPQRLIDFLASMRGINAVSARLTDLFQNHGLKVHYTANGVDSEIFKCIKRPPLSEKLIVGYSGSKAHDWRKGVTKFILPATKKTKAEVKIAMLSTDNYVPLEQMYSFYNEIDCYVCASSSEGMSLSVLEAAGCGRPIITTKISGCTEIIKDNETGFFVDRKVGSIADKLRILKSREKLVQMSESVERDIKQNWCWSKRARKWIDFLLEA